jgi:hypothetical protein
MNQSIPHRNISPHGWWVATYVERAAWDDEEPAAPDLECQVWENTIILLAPDRDAAYTKAIALASANENEFSDADDVSRTGRWVFEGLLSLLPIYDELGDGAEISWQDHPAVTVQKMRSWIRAKDQLEVFDDSPLDD